MNTTTKTLAQLQADAVAAQEALRAAEVAAAEAEKAEKAEQARAAEIVRREALRNMPVPASYAERSVWLNAIAEVARAALRVDKLAATVDVVESSKSVLETDSGPQVNWTAPHISAKLNGADVYTFIAFEGERTRISSWRSQANGKMRMSVGHYGERTSYPQRKDGSFNYEAAAQHIVNCVHKAHYEAKAKAAVANNWRALTSMKEEFGLKEHSSVLRSSGAEGKFIFKLEGSMTEEQVRAILTAAVNAGVAL